MTTINLKAPAKINLWLDVMAKRADGYHDIESVMQSVTLFDEITIDRQETPAGLRSRRHIAISCTVNELACDESNLCYRAAQEFFSAAKIRSYSVAIHIEKRIPIAAGLAGGSTDAATTLIGLNQLYETALSSERLYEIGRKLGADVPFCIKRGISVTRGIGEIFTDCRRMPDCTILVACDGERMSTPAAYAALDELYDFTHRASRVARFTQLLEVGSIQEIAAAMSNLFESAILPIRQRASDLKQRMLGCGALNALMSGSGPSVFGIFESADAAKRARDILAQSGIQALICEPYYDN